jgi:hypothetical protein
MTDSKENKNSPLRLDPAFRKELKREIGSIMAQGGHATYSSLLERAWRAYKQSPQLIPTVTAAEPATKVLPLTPTLLPDEQKAVDLLLTIMREGSETAKKAIVWNLHGFAEPIKSKGAHGERDESAPNIELSEALERVIQSAEELGKTEEDRRRWLADVQQLKDRFDNVRGKAEIAAKPRRKRGS